MLFYGYLIIFSWIFHIFSPMAHASSAATSVAEHIPLQGINSWTHRTGANSFSQHIPTAQDTEDFLVLREGSEKPCRSPLSFE